MKFTTLLFACALVSITAEARTPIPAIRFVDEAALANAQAPFTVFVRGIRGRADYSADHANCKSLKVGGFDSSSSPASYPAREAALRAENNCYRHPDGRSGLDQKIEQGNASDLGAGSPITASYTWHFGDSAGRYNELSGFSAAHVYDRPGTYVISLTVTNELGETAQVSRTIRINGAARPELFVNNGMGTASDGNPGDDPNRPIASIAGLNRRLATMKTLGLLNNGVKIQFRRGRNFVSSESLNLGGLSNVWVTSYPAGDGGRAKITMSNSESAIRTNDSSRGITIDQIDFNSSGASRATALSAGGTRITLRDVQFSKVSSGVNANIKPSGLLVMDSRTKDSKSLENCFTWIEGTDAVLLGNVAHWSINEHIVRSSDKHFERALLFANDFTAKDAKPSNLQLRRGRFFYIAGNTIRGGDTRTGGDWGWDRSTSPAQPREPFQRAEWIVIERNLFKSARVLFEHSSHQVMARNNVFEGGNGDNPHFTIAASAADSVYGLSTGLHIKNNSAQSSKNRFLVIESAPQFKQVLVENNLHVRAGGAATKSSLDLRGDPQGLSIFSMKSNIWVAARDASLYPFEASSAIRNGSPLKVGFMPAENTGALRFAVPTRGVSADFRLKRRPAGAWTAGAVQVD